MTSASPLGAILQDASLVGGIYRMGFQDCEILTHDLWKARVKGIAHSAILLATPMLKQDQTHKPEHRYFFVLRVTGQADLPYESDLENTRAHAMRKMMTQKAPTIQRLDEALNTVIHNEVSFGGLAARVLGTLREKDGFLEFRGDIDSYMTHSHYFVYKPGNTGLGTVVNLHRSLPTNGGKTAPFMLGSYRESTSGEASIPFIVNILDFISMKTGVLGMTRLGKSNTLKVLALGTLMESARRQTDKVGQLIFDPTGEYAYPTRQDNSTCVAMVDPGRVRIYAGANKKPPQGMQVERLTLNLFSQEDAAFVWSLVNFELKERAAEAQYIANFLAQSIVPEQTSPEEPSDEDDEGDEEETQSYSARQKAENNRSAFYAALISRDFSPPAKLTTRVTANKDVCEKLLPRLNQAKKAVESAKKGRILLQSPAQITDFWDAVVAEAPPKLGKDKFSKWLANGVWDHIQIQRTGSATGNFLRLKQYHDANAQQDFRKRIRADLKAGHLVIVDTSALTVDFGARVNEFIVRYIISEGLQDFSETQEPPRIQVYVEEAHKFFARPADVKRKERDSPWVMLAKEAAKLRIGLVYATQEPSNVDPEIRNNTANWVITRLNNREELSLLAKYEDFEDFAESIQRTEEIGYARVKTASGPFTLVVQIRKFDQQLVAEVQAALKGQEGKKDA